MVVCCNFTPAARHGYAVGVPQGGRYQEIFNSDSQHDNGSNAGNGLGVVARQPGSHGRPFPLRLTLPPLAAVMFKPQRDNDHARG